VDGRRESAFQLRSTGDAGVIAIKLALQYKPGTDRTGVGGTRGVSCARVGDNNQLAE
jgi:hypothetical protein